MLRSVLSSALSKLSNTSSVRSLTTSSPLHTERGFCEVRLLGRVGHSPKEFEGTASKIVTFSVGVNRLVQSRVDNDSLAEKEIIHWHNLVVFRPALQSHVLQNITKGCRVLCSGRLENRIVHKRNESEGPSSIKLTSVILDDVILLGRPQHLSLEDADDSFSDDDSIV